MTTATRTTATPIDPPDVRAHGPALALLLGTVFWGCAFTWAKAGGEDLNDAAGLPAGAALGPVLLLAWRFVLGAAAWFVVFPASRRGWTWRSAGRAALIGGLSAVGLVLQHLGLDRTSEATSAFLTALMVVFVPLLMTVVVRRPPPGAVWAGVAVATAGVWLMTGAAPGGFGLGEALGLASAFAFSVYVLAINALVPRDDPHRMAAGQFLAVGLATAAVCPFLAGGTDPGHLALPVTEPRVWPMLALLVAFPTIGGYGLLTFFQPRVDPTRASLVYLMEPIVAAAFAWATAGRGMDARALLGAGLILVANAMVELRGTLARRGEPVPISAARPTGSPRTAR
jgi:drug/metabolite transporter (DMT)-like permease